MTHTEYTPNDKRNISLKNKGFAVSICLLVITNLFSAAKAEHLTKTDQVDSESVVQSFEKLFGIHQGKRRNHTKGFCFDGVLIPTDKSVQNLSESQLFLSESKVIGRLSHKGGNLKAPDNVPADYGMGLSITTSSGETQLMSMNTLPFFPMATPQAFAELMRAKVKGGDEVKTFKAQNSDLQRFKEYEATKPKLLSPYEAATFNSINSFYLLNSVGDKTAVRWSFVPTKQQPLQFKPSENFFFKNLQKNLEEGEVAWNMVLTLANSDDEIENPAIAWEGDRQRYIGAKLIVESISSEQDGKCDLINFDPLVLASGFAPSADPILQARRNTYAVGFAKRLSEKQ